MLYFNYGQKFICYRIIDYTELEGIHVNLEKSNFWVPLGFQAKLREEMSVKQN